VAIESEMQRRLNNLALQAWTATPDGALNFVNQFACDYFGLGREALVRDGWHDVLHPADVEATVKNWQRSLETGETYENEFRLLRYKDRTYRWHRARAMPIRDADGSISGWSGTNTDIDEWKRQLEIESARVARQQTGGLSL
jgi:PAS domain S-box-containing protein